YCYSSWPGGDDPRLFSQNRSPSSALHTLSLHDALPIFLAESLYQQQNFLGARTYFRELLNLHRSHYKQALQRYLEVAGKLNDFSDRKSTRLNSSHDQISYAVFCLK